MDIDEWISISSHSASVLGTVVPTLAVFASALLTHRMTRNSEREIRAEHATEWYRSVRHQLRHEISTNQRLLRNWIARDQVAESDDQILALLDMAHIPDRVLLSPPSFISDVWQSQLIYIPHALALDEQMQAWEFYASLKEFVSLVEGLQDMHATDSGRLTPRFYSNLQSTQPRLRSLAQQLLTADPMTKDDPPTRPALTLPG